MAATGALVLHGVDPWIALAVPITLSTAAVGVMRWLTTTSALAWPLSEAIAAGA
ncbi:hypothetical protein ACWZHB_13655 [Nocardia sp. FBN12]|uniref:hypothetical protein n=1 Tax=Nocardia sp. FBN12 TaxID=3419766 RepID=UPI003D05FAF6